MAFDQPLWDEVLWGETVTTEGAVLGRVSLSFGIVALPSVTLSLNSLPCCTIEV
jgi:hypothetical protein